MPHEKKRRSGLIFIKNLTRNLMILKIFLDQNKKEESGRNLRKKVKTAPKKAKIQKMLSGNRFPVFGKPVSCTQFSNLAQKNSSGNRFPVYGKPVSAAETTFF